MEHLGLVFNSLSLPFLLPNIPMVGFLKKGVIHNILGRNEKNKCK